MNICFQPLNLFISRQISYHSYEHMCNLEGTRLASHPEIDNNLALVVDLATAQGHQADKLFLGIRRDQDSNIAMLSRQYEPMEDATYTSAFDSLGSDPGCRTLDVSAAGVIGAEKCQWMPAVAEPQRRRGLCQYTDCYSDSNPAYACSFPFR